MLVLGRMSLGGNIIPIEYLAEALQVAHDSGAKRVLRRWPVSATFQQSPANYSQSSKRVFTLILETQRLRRWGLSKDTG